MELLLIRHGEPAWSRAGLSVDDPSLTARGQQQALYLADRLQDLAVDRLLVSPLVRAQETAAPLAEALGIEPTTVDWLAEITNPSWEGTPVDEVERTFRAALQRSVDDLWDGLPGGESFRDFHERVTTGLHGLLGELGVERCSDHPPLWSLDRPPHRVVVVAHTGTNSVALGELLGVPPVPWEWERFVSFHASVSTVRPFELAGCHTFSLFRFADVGHLPESMHTV